MCSPKKCWPPKMLTPFFNYFFLGGGKKKWKKIPNNFLAISGNSKHISFFPKKTYKIDTKILDSSYNSTEQQHKISLYLFNEWSLVSLSNSNNTLFFTKMYQQIQPDNVQGVNHYYLNKLLMLNDEAQKLKKYYYKPTHLGTAK